MIYAGIHLPKLKNHFMVSVVKLFEYITSPPRFRSDWILQRVGMDADSSWIHKSTG